VLSLIQRVFPGPVAQKLALALKNEKARHLYGKAKYRFEGSLDQQSGSRDQRGKSGALSIYTKSH
jgi:hypothetical protein